MVRIGCVGMSGPGIGGHMSRAKARRRRGNGTTEGAEEVPFNTDWTRIGALRGAQARTASPAFGSSLVPAVRLNFVPPPCLSSRGASARFAEKIELEN